MALAYPLAPGFFGPAVAVQVSPASGIIPALTWALLLHDVSWDSGPLRLPMVVPALQGTARPLFLAGLGLRHTVRAARGLGVACWCSRGRTRIDASSV